jgi:hypothetical protein
MDLPNVFLVGETTVASWIGEEEAALAFALELNTLASMYGAALTVSVAIISASWLILPHMYNAAAMLIRHRRALTLSQLDALPHPESPSKLVPISLAAKTTGGKLRPRATARYRQNGDLQKLDSSVQANPHALQLLCACVFI